LIRLAILTKQSYYIAPWQALTTALPALNITERICSTAAPNATIASTSDAALSLATPPPTVLHCIDIYEVWSTSITTSTSSFTSTIDISTIIPNGRKQVIVGPITTSMKEAETLLELHTELVLPTNVEKEAVVTSTIKAVSSTSTMIVWPAPLAGNAKEKEKAIER